MGLLDRFNSAPTDPGSYQSYTSGGGTDYLSAIAQYYGANPGSLEDYLAANTGEGNYYATGLDPFSERQQATAQYQALLDKYNQGQALLASQAPQKGQNYTAAQIAQMTGSPLNTFNTYQGIPVATANNPLASGSVDQFIQNPDGTYRVANLYGLNPDVQVNAPSGGDWTDIMNTAITAASAIGAGIATGGAAMAAFAPEAGAAASTDAYMASAGLNPGTYGSAVGSGVGGTAGGGIAADPVAAAAYNAGEAVPFQLPDGSMGSIQGGNILDSSGSVVAPGGTSGLTASQIASALSAAKSGISLAGGLASLAGGAANIAGGISATNAGKTLGTLAGQADPFASSRQQYVNQLNQLMANPYSVTQTPGYQFQYGQGLNALQAAQAKQGNLVSGGALAQAQQYGQGLASNQYQTQLSNLMQLSGASQSPAAGTTAAGNLVAGQTGANLGGIQSIAQGVGTLGTGVSNAVSGIQGLYNMYNQPSPYTDIASSGGYGVSGAGADLTGGLGFNLPSF